jgi:hypothetical protein
MRRPDAMLILFFSLSMVQCNHPSATDDPELLSNLRFAPGAFDSFRRNTELKFTLRHPVTLDITIESKAAPGADFVVKTLVQNAYQTKGSHSIAWLGDTDAELFAPAGVYIGVLNISNRRFETTVQVYH